jgi:midasin
MEDGNNIPETEDNLMDIDQAHEIIDGDEEKSKDDQPEIPESNYNNESTTCKGADHNNQDNTNGSEERNENSYDVESSAQNPSENENMRKEVGPSLPSESQARSPVDAETLEAVLESINKSVHSIMENDKVFEGKHSNDIEFSLQQMYQKTDDQNGVGLISGVKETDGMSEKVNTHNENLSIDLDDDEDSSGKFDGIDDHSSKNNGQRMMSKTNEPVHFDSKDIAVPEMNLTYNWDHIDSEVFPLAMELCEQLRLVLEPTKASKMKGDYRTGKRLNLRKLIPYIISQYRKDKIWLRRTKPNKRTYRICLSIDNSKSMKDNCCDLLALKTVSMLTQAFTRLEAGKLSLIGFGDDAQVIVPLSDVPSMDSGSLIMNNLRFGSEMTNMPAMLEKVINLFSSDYDGDGLSWDLNIIISDGVCKEHNRLQQLLNESISKRIVNIFVILDTKPVSESILEMNRVEYVPALNSKGEFTGETTIKMRKYLETFPFENYIVVRDVSHLPQVLSDSIRQWFELLTYMN